MENKKDEKWLFALLFREAFSSGDEFCRSDRVMNFIAGCFLLIFEPIYRLIESFDNQ